MRIVGAGKRQERTGDTHLEGICAQAGEALKIVGERLILETGREVLGEGKRIERKVLVKNPKTDFFRTEEARKQRDEAGGYSDHSDMEKGRKSEKSQTDAGENAGLNPNPTKKSASESLARKKHGQDFLGRSYQLELSNSPRHGKEI